MDNLPSIALIVGLLCVAIVVAATAVAVVSLAVWLADNLPKEGE